MKKIDIVSIAFSNFKRRKTRSILTVLGVVIGVSSIVVMVSLGIAVNESFEKTLGNIGDLTTVSVNAGYNPDSGKETNVLDDKAVEKLKQIENVTAVSPLIRLNGKFICGKYIGNVGLMGVDSNLLKSLGFETEQGTIDGFSENKLKSYNCIVGSEVPYLFENPRKGNQHGGMRYGEMEGDGESRELPEVNLMDKSPKLRFTFDHSYGEKNLGMDMEVKKKPVFYNMNTIGIMKKQMSDKDYNIYIDLEAAKKLKKEQTKFEQAQSGSTTKKNNKLVYDEIRVLTANIKDTAAVTEAAKKLGFEAYSQAESINKFKKMTKILQLVLGGIGSISLIVAAIGIANTMIMSIYERTKEIGIMKVIGCQLKDIRSMFLYEASFIGLFGGAIGLLLSYGSSTVLNMFGKSLGEKNGEEVILSVIPIWLAILAVIFAIFIALLAGFLPARRAMKLSALEAMRN